MPKIEAEASALKTLANLSPQPQGKNPYFYLPTYLYLVLVKKRKLEVKIKIPKPPPPIIKEGVKCDICQRLCKTASGLSAHIRIGHKNVDPKRFVLIDLLEMFFGNII